MKDNQRSSLLDRHKFNAFNPRAAQLYGSQMWKTKMRSDHFLIISTISFSQHNKQYSKPSKEKKNRNTKPQAPKKQAKRHNSAQRRQHHPEGNNHSGEEVNKTSCPTLHVFRVGICRRPMSSSLPPPPPPPVGC